MESHRKVLTGKLKRSRVHSQSPALMAAYWRIPIIWHSGICKNYTSRKTSVETEEGADCRGGCSPRECGRLMVHLDYGDGYRTVCVVQLWELRTKKSEFYCIWTQMSAGQGRATARGRETNVIRAKVRTTKAGMLAAKLAQCVWIQDCLTSSAVSLCGTWDWWATNVCYTQLWLLT